MILGIDRFERKRLLFVAVLIALAGPAASGLALERVSA
jgi:hypothetical protein